MRTLSTVNRLSREHKQAIHSFTLTHTCTRTLYRCECYVRCNQLLQSTRGKEWRRMKETTTTMHTIRNIGSEIFCVQNREQINCVRFFPLVHSLFDRSFKPIHTLFLTHTCTHMQICWPKKTSTFWIEIEFAWRTIFKKILRCEYRTNCNRIKHYFRLCLITNWICRTSRRKKERDPNRKHQMNQRANGKKKSKITHRYIETDSPYYFPRFYSHLCWCNCNICFIYFTFVWFSLFFWFAFLSYTHTKIFFLLLLLLYTLWDDNYFSVKFTFFFHLKIFYCILSNGGRYNRNGTKQNE